MKILMINGSPHKNGCTYSALAEAGKVFAEEGIDHESIWIGNRPIGGCSACLSCKKTGICALDDVVNEFRPKFKEADAFIFGSPVHYGSMAANMKGFMDRLFYSETRMGRQNAFYLKPAAAVVSARRTGISGTFDEFIRYFVLSEMPVISSRYWNSVHGAKAEQIYEDKEGIFVVRTLARNMSYFLKCQEVARAAGIPSPVMEERVATPFIR